MYMHDTIKLICFDLDDTVTSDNSWRRLNPALGMTQEEDLMMLGWYEQGIINYQMWGDLSLAIYKQRGKDTLANIDAALSKYEIREGVKETVCDLQDKGYYVALISSAVDIYVDKVAKELGIELSESNNIFVFDSNNRLEKIVVYSESGLGKLRHLESFCRKLGLQISECACIGDGANDLEMFKATGHGITFKGSPIEKDAWQVIEKISDLQSIF